MNWQPIETAPKTGKCIGYDPKLKQPFVMHWNFADNAFEAGGGLGTENPHYWLPLPATNDAAWLPIESAPKDGYLVARDPALKHPIVIKWDTRKAAFKAVNGFGDETPTHYMLLPAFPQ